jgi:hypothetical protein
MSVDRFTEQEAQLFNDLLVRHVQVKVGVVASSAVSMLYAALVTLAQNGNETATQAVRAAIVGLERLDGEVAP